MARDVSPAQERRPPGPVAAWEAYRMRWKRRRLLARAWRKRGELTAVTPHPHQPRGAILCFSVMRNEAVRLPHWLAHHRRLGVDRFLIVDNDSDDGTARMLAAAPDVSLWRTSARYRDSRFGVDWLNLLMGRHGAGHWCLVADADELLVYPHHDTRDLRALAAELDRRGQPALGALMVELFPKGPLSAAPYAPGQDPAQAIPFFDPAGYRAARQRPARNLWVQGGPRDRVFFADAPRRAPTLNKLPFVRWRRGYAWLNSAHSALPPRLNLCWDGPGDTRLSGALMHTKFLNVVAAKSAEEKVRRQHFGDPDAAAAYHDAILADPDLWHPGAARYTGWRDLERAGLLSAGGW